MRHNCIAQEEEGGFHLHTYTHISPRALPLFKRVSGYFRGVCCRVCRAERGGGARGNGKRTHTKGQAKRLPTRQNLRGHTEKTRRSSQSERHIVPLLQSTSCRHSHTHPQKTGGAGNVRFKKRREAPKVLFFVFFACLPRLFPFLLPRCRVFCDEEMNVHAPSSSLCVHTASPPPPQALHSHSTIVLSFVVFAANRPPPSQLSSPSSAQRDKYALYNSLHTAPLTHPLHPSLSSLFHRKEACPPPRRTTTSWK